jgi:hypothetical protein
MKKNNTNIVLYKITQVLTLRCSTFKAQEQYMKSLSSSLLIRSYKVVMTYNNNNNGDNNSSSNSSNINNNVIMTMMTSEWWNDQDSVIRW